MLPFIKGVIFFATYEFIVDILICYIYQSLLKSYMKFLNLLQ